MSRGSMFVCQGTAWALVFTFLRADWKKSSLVTALSALAAVLIQSLLLWQGWTGLNLAVLLGVSFFTAVALPEMFHISHWSATVAFLLGYGGGSLLCVCGENLLLLVGLVCIFGVLTAVSMPHFPQRGWQEMLSGSPPVGTRFAWQLTLVFAVSCLMTSIAALLPVSGVTKAAVCLLAASIYWGGIFLVISLVECCRISLAVSSEKQYRAEMTAFMNVIRSQRHDYNFHVRTLAGLVRKGDLSACCAYLEELVQDSTAMNEVLPIWDPAISATIFSFRTLAAREGITLHIDVQNDLRHIATNVYETNKIISNLLQNAIDAVRPQADKSFGIWLYILKRGQFCIIHTANPFCGECSAAHIGDIFRQGYTTKQGHDGVGLSSIKSLAERRHGLVYARLEEGIIHFIAKIPLQYETSDEDKYRREPD